MRLKTKFFLLTAVFAVAVSILTVIWLVAFWHKLSPAEESLFKYIFMNRFAFIFLASFLLLCGVALVIGGLLHYYLIPLKRLCEETTLITTVNPSHRIIPDGAKDIRRLAEIANEGAHRFETLRKRVREITRRAKIEADEEKAILAAIMAQLTEGVMVCNTAGKILFYNERARQMLSWEGRENDNPMEQAGVVGLGRSIFDLNDGPRISHGINEVEKQLLRGELNAAYSFITTGESHDVFIAHGQALQIEIVPILDQQKQKSGFILVIKDIAKKRVVEGYDEETSLQVSAQAGMPSEEEHERQVNFSWASRPEFYDFDLFHQSGSTAEIEKQPLEDLIYTVFDTETTGLDPADGDEIISIGAVRVVNTRLLQQENFNQLIDPQRYMRSSAIRIHGITPEMLKGQPTIDKVLPSFHRFAQDTILVAHNAAFDMRFLQLKEEKTGIKFDNPVLDTLLLSEVVHTSQEAHSLESIAMRLGINPEGRHTALGDALLAGNVLIKLIHLLKEKGIITLKEALHASKETYYSKLKY